MRWLLIGLLMLTGCDDVQFKSVVCLEYSPVVQLGQCGCTYKCLSTECRVKTKSGHLVTVNEPSAIGDRVCVKRGYE